MKTGFTWVGIVTALGAVGAHAGMVDLNGGAGIVLDDPPIAIGAGWSETTDTPPAFFWSGGPNALNLEGPYTFHAAGPVVLSVTDAFIQGDRFEVFDFGVSLGLTSLPAGGGSPETPDPNLAFGNADYSFGVFNLGAGDHSITFAAVENPFGGGRGYLRVDRAGRPTATPDTGSTLLLSALGMGGLVMARRWPGRR